MPEPTIFNMVLFIYVIPFAISMIFGAILQRKDPNGGWKNIGYLSYVPGVNMISSVIALGMMVAAIGFFIVELLYGPDKVADKPKIEKRRYL